MSNQPNGPDPSPINGLDVWENEGGAHALLQQGPTGVPGAHEPRPAPPSPPG